MYGDGWDDEKKMWGWLRPFRSPRPLSALAGPKLVIPHSPPAWVFRVASIP